MAIPKPTPLKPDVVESDKIEKEIPEQTPEVKKKPRKSTIITEIPEESPEKENIEKESELKSEMPKEEGDENCVIINGEKKEIKPTKLKYFRNKTAGAYNILRGIPLSELLTVGKGILDENRDGDQIVYDFLVASFDDPDFVRDNYNDLDADQIEQVVNIVGRLNHIEEKLEAQRKNREAQAAKR